MINWLCQCFYGVIMVTNPPVRNKEKQKESAKKYYQKNRESVIAKISVNKRKSRVHWDLFKSTLRCTKCGETHPATLDFHHVVKDPTNKKINQLTRNGAYKQAIEEILSKCIVLCSNCHRKHHHEERNPLKVALVSDVSSPEA